MPSSFSSRRTFVSEPLETRILFAAPDVIDSEFLFQNGPNQLRVQFDQDVSASLIKEDLSLHSVSTATPADEILTATSMTWDPSTHTATFTLPGSQFGELADGNYRAVLHAEDIQNASSETMAVDHIHDDSDFFMWSGDTDHDRDVDLNDLMNLSTYYGTPGPHDYSHGDSDYDGDVDLNDHGRLAGKYGTTLAAPPTSFEEISVSGLSSSEILIDWLDDPDLTETSYRVRISTDGVNFLEEDFFTVDGSETSLNVTGLEDGMKYWFKLRRFASQGNTAYTPHKSAATVLPAPTNLSAMVLSNTSVRLNWQDNSTNETSFNILLSTDGGETFEQFDMVDGDIEQVDLIGLTRGTAYQFQVVAEGNGGTMSAASSTQSAVAGNTLPSVGGKVYEWTVGTPPEQTFHGVTIESSWSPELTHTAVNGNDGFSLTLGNLPLHSGVRVSFSAIGWNHDAPPDEDQLNLTVAGETFSGDIPDAPIFNLLTTGDMEHIDETLTITLSGSNFETGSLTDDGWHADNVEVTLMPLPTVSISKVQDGSEDPDPSHPNDGPKPVKFRVSRSGGTTDQELRVYVKQPGGTAKSADFGGQIPTSMLIPEDKSFVEFSLVPEDDDEVEPTETIELTLKDDPQGLYLLANPLNPPKAEGGITDNEAHLTGTTVISGATQTNVTGKENWVAVKNAAGFVIVEASLSKAVTDEQAAELITWTGGEAVEGEPLQRKIQKAIAKKTSVTATDGVNSEHEDIWVIWSEIEIRMAGETSEDSTAKHPAPGFGGQVLGALTDEDHFLGVTEAIGKIEFVATITPDGVHDILQSGFDLHQRVTGKWFDNGALTIELDEADDPVANFKDLTPNAGDKIYYVDGPTAGLEFDVNHTAERYNNFSSWVMWNGERISDIDAGKWHYFARIDDDLDIANRQPDGSGNDDTELNDLGLGNPELPVNAHYNPR